MKCLLLVLLSALLLTAGFGQTPTPTDSNQKPSDDSVLVPQDDVLRVETDLVTTLFTAKDKNQTFVTELRKEDVRILENGVEQEVTLFERETNRPLSIAILIDTSGSQERTLPEEKRAAKKFVEEIVRPESDRIGIVSFNGLPTIESPLGDSIGDANAAIESVKVELRAEGCSSGVPVTEDPRCWTSIWDAVFATSDQMLGPTRTDSRRAIILLTDGDDTSSRVDRADAIKVSVAKDVVVYGIGIGDPEMYRIEKGALNKLTTRTGGRSFFPRADAELAAAFSQIGQELRSQYVIAYSPRDKTRDGSFRKLKIEVVNPVVKKRKLTLLHRPGYYSSQTPTN